MFLVFCRSSDDVFIGAKFYESISEGFRVTDLNSRVDARMVANVDDSTDGRTYGRTDKRTDRWKTGPLYRAVPKAGMTKMGSREHEC